MTNLTPQQALDATGTTQYVNKDILETAPTHTGEVETCSTMPNLLPRLRARIAELVPEIMKLEFGCHVYVKKWDSVWTFVAHEGLPNESMSKNMTLIKDGKVQFCFGNEEGEILGRPITFADVLRAIAKVKGTDGFVLMASNGWLSDGANRCYYDLSKSFDDQDPPVHKWVARVIGVEV